MNAQARCLCGLAIKSSIASAFTFVKLAISLTFIRESVRLNSAPHSPCRPYRVVIYFRRNPLLAECGPDRHPLRGEY